MDPAILQQIGQFGPAGLIGVLWILERRYAVQRERELSQAHQRLMEQQMALGELVTIAKDNTAAMKAIERSQTQVMGLLERLTGGAGKSGEA